MPHLQRSASARNIQAQKRSGHRIRKSTPQPQRTHNMQSTCFPAIIGVLALLASPVLADDAPLFEEDGPFRQGEGFGTPATCETIANWIDRVPDYNGRITMNITGAIIENHWDGALAYLIMCAPEGIQVMCVTYAPQEITGEEIMFAGGYNRYSDTQILLDPCLVYPVGTVSDLR